MSFLNNFNKIRNVKNLKFLVKIKPKKLCFGFTKKGGRNFSGKITSFYKGGEHKKLYRIIDFNRSLLFFWNILGFVRSIEYDPNRSAFIALIQYGNGFVSYILASESLTIGDFIYTGMPKHFNIGSRIPLSFIGFGKKFSNLRYYSRAAGTFLKYLGLDAKNRAIIGLPSGTKKLTTFDSLVTLGSISNKKHYSKKLYKAGQSRWLGIRPHVRGVAKNPIDHPHGGGQGKTSGGRVSVTPWGIYTKGYKTKRKKSKKNNILFF